MYATEDYYKSIFGDFHLYCGDMDDVGVQEYIRVSGVFASELSQWLVDNIKPGWVCYDIGSNVGQMAMIMSMAAKSAGAVYAFEAQARLAEAFEYGKRFANLSDAAEVVMYPIGLSDKKTTSQIKIDIANRGGSTLNAEMIDYTRPENYAHEFVSVELDRLDSLDLPSPDIIKFDIEGHEAEAWLGFTQEAKECPIIIAEVGFYTQEWLIAEYLSYGRKAYTLSGQPLENTVQGVRNYLEFLNSYQQDDIIFRRD